MNIFHVTVTETKDTLLAERSSINDSWAQHLRARLLHVHDIPAAEAAYHRSFSVNLRTGKCVPQTLKNIGIQTIRTHDPT